MEDIAEENTVIPFTPPVKQGIKDCCRKYMRSRSRWKKVVAMLRAAWRYKGWPTPERSLYICSTCGCRHFRVSADPGVLGIAGKQLGSDKVDRQ